MKALVLRAPHELTLEEREDPQPGDDDVVLEVLMGGICGSDLDGYTGASNRRPAGVVMGHEAVGHITDTRTPKAREGDLVTFSPIVSCGRCPACTAGLDNRCAARTLIGGHLHHGGAFAERVRVPAGNVTAWPTSAPPSVGAMVEPIAVGLHAAQRAGVNEAVPAVLVLGAGMIGLACAFAARTLGADHVVVYDPQLVKATKATLVGAAPCLPGDDPVESHLRDQWPAGFPMVFDAVGSSRSLATAVALSAVGGTVTVVGMAAATPSLALHDLVGAERTITSSYAYPMTVFREAAEVCAEASDAIALLCDRTYPLADGPLAFAALTDSSSTVTKALLVPERA